MPLALGASPVQVLGMPPPPLYRSLVLWVDEKDLEKDDEAER